MKKIFLSIFLLAACALSYAQQPAAENYKVEKVVELNSHKRCIRQYDNFLVENGFCYLLDLKSQRIFVFDENGKLVEESQTHGSEAAVTSEIADKLLQPQVAEAPENLPHFTGFFEYKKLYRSGNQLVYLITQAQIERIDSYKKAMSFAQWQKTVSESCEAMQQLITGEKQAPVLVYVSEKQKNN